MRSLVATPFLALALVLALLPGAHAQAPTTTVTVTGPATLTGLTSNNTTESGDFTVDVRVANLVCPTGGTIPVTVTVEAPGAPAFAVFTVEPTEGTIAIPQGQSVSASAGGSFPVKVKATMQEITANATVPVTVKAAAGAPQGCQGAGNAPPSEGSATMNATITAPPPPPPAPEEPAESPGPGAVMGVLAALAAASLRRRRA